MNNEKRQEYIQDILSGFQKDDKRKQVWVLKDAKGNILRLKSGKSSWRQRNHATSALVNHIYLDWKDKEDLGFRSVTAEEKSPTDRNRAPNNTMPR